MIRRGYTLLELLVAMTVGSVVVGMSVCMLHLLLRVEHTGRDRVHQSRVFARLAEQFRGDVRAALKHKPFTPSAPWQFALAEDRLVTYKLLPGEVRWEEQVAGKLVRQEVYLLPDNCTATIAVDSQASPSVASLTVSGHGPPSSPGHELRITAVLGRDHRFSKERP